MMSVFSSVDFSGAFGPRFVADLSILDVLSPPSRFYRGPKTTAVTPECRHLTLALNVDATI